MGDISTHKEVVLHMIPQLKEISEDENYTYIEFGNFLTDISQLRDPVAFPSAKGDIRAGVWIKPIGSLLLCGELDGALGTEDVNEWLDVMFGDPSVENKRHGALPTFFRHFGRGVAHIKFSADSTTRNDPVLAPLTAAEIDRVYDAAFTQYYPHEHVDYPPFEPVKHPENGPDYQPGRRGLMQYLERQIQFISEELSKIEFEWLQNRTLPADHPTRCDLLVRLGHILHAVEDFYFHSNAVEIRQWNRIVKQNPGRDPKKPADYHFLVDHLLDGTGLDVTSVRFRRRLARRLRYPDYLDTSSAPLIGQPQRLTVPADSVYTGGFGTTDVAHTISGGLAGIEESLKVSNPLLLAAFQNIDIPLLQLLFSEAEREAVAESCGNLSERLTRHKVQVANATYPALLEAAQAAGVLTTPAKDAFVTALGMDPQISVRFPGKPGPGGFLFVWMRIIQDKVNKSHEKAAALDGDANSPYDTFVYNDASEESVATHSLMSKDGIDKEPLRKHAMALAKCASAALAVTLRQRIKDDPDTDKGFDWDRLLRHFMRVPPGRSDSWEEEVLSAVDGGLDVPPIGSLQDKPNVTLQSGALVRTRRSGSKRLVLENNYRRLEAPANPSSGN